MSMSRSRSILSGNMACRAGPFQGICLRIFLQGPTPGFRQSSGTHGATGIGRRKRESAQQHTHLHAGESTCTQWHQDRERFIRHASYAYACEAKMKSCMPCLNCACAGGDGAFSPAAACLFVMALWGSPCGNAGCGALALQLAIWI